MRKVLLLGLVPLLALAGTVTRTIMFDSRDLAFSRANGYDVVRLSDFITTLELGKPMMPEAVFNVLVPAGATVTNIEVFPLEPEEIPGTYRIHPAQHPVTISAGKMPEFVEPDAATYSSSRAYPGKLVDWTRTGTKSNFRLCGFCLHPLAYVPATGKLTLYRRMRVEVSYSEGSVDAGPLTPGQLGLFSRDVAGLVINPDDVARFSPPVRHTDDPDVDYAIITTNAQSTWFANLVDWRAKKGLNTQVFTTEWISTNYPSGRDLQEKIRMFIIDYFNTRGLKFVLLAGDNAQVPGRRCRAIVSGQTGNIPADVYYADLQWSYDGNRNNIFGEISGDTVDLYYDVYVGRASVDNQTQATTFVTKTLNYEKTPTTDYLKKVLLPYVMLFSSQNYSGKVVSDSIANQTPVGWTDQYIANPTSTTPMRDAINQGYHLCHVAAHGNATGFYTEGGSAIWNTSTAGAQTNSTRPVIMNSIACISGDFETSDCLAEAAMNNANGGAVACMMNSRLGWGTPPSMGPSEKLSNKFYTYFFGYDTADIGVLHARAKDFYVYVVQTQEVWRWCYWDLNLFGDPNMLLWKDVPTTMDAAHASTIQTGVQSFAVTVTSGGNPVANALVSCCKSGEVYARGMTNASGQVNLTINPLTTGTMHVTATCATKLPVEHTVTVTQGAPQPYISYLGHFVDDGNNNRLDPGETANLWITVKNIGNAQATTVAGKLRTGSTYITLVDSSSSYGTLNQNDTSRGDFYRLTASSGTPPGTRIPFTVHITADQGSWSPSFELVVGQPIQPGVVVMDHDTGYCKLSVTCLGSIGFTEPPGDLDIGSGFSYPKASASQLYYGSFALGNSDAYLVDRHFGRPASSGPNTDFAIVESITAMLPPGSGDEHFRARMSDAGHPSPKGLRVTQHSHQCAAPGYDDFVVMVYDITNPGASAVNGLYAGILADFDIGSNPATNTVTSNETKRFSYMRQSSSANPCVGVKILEPASFANLAAIDHARYVYPDSAMSDGMKWRFLNGTIVQRNSSRNYDWSVCTSVGPFDLGVGASKRVAFALVGGISAANFEENADSAQSWYNSNTGVADERPPRIQDVVGLRCVPNPFTGAVNVSMQLPAAGRVRAEVFDISGRTVATLLDEVRAAGRVQSVWRPAGLANGVYLLKVSMPDGSVTEKLLLMR